MINSKTFKKFMQNADGTRIISERCFEVGNTLYVTITDSSLTKLNDFAEDTWIKPFYNDLHLPFDFRIISDNCLKVEFDETIDTENQGEVIKWKNWAQMLIELINNRISEKEDIFDFEYDFYEAGCELEYSSIIICDTLEEAVRKSTIIWNEFHAPLIERDKNIETFLNISVN